MSRLRNTRNGIIALRNIRLMAELPKTLEEAIAQSREATKAALADGYTRIQVELVFPEIALKSQSIAQQFISAFEDLGSSLKVLFPDAGAAALARRDWGEVSFKIEDIGIGRRPIDQKIQPEDQVLLLVAPTSVEVAQVEKLCEAIGDRPIVLLNPRLEDAGTVGIGYAGRALRDRFLSTLESCYYLRALDGAAVLRCYPASWQVWLESGDGYKLIAEVPKRPVGDELDQIIAEATGATGTGDTPQPKKAGVLTGLQRFLRALSR